MMLLNSPFGRSIFHEYKKSALLPEVIARNHGHEHTALYLEGITNRLVFYTADPRHKNAASNRYLDTVSLSVFFFFSGSLFKNTVNSSNSFPGSCYPFPVLSSSRETSRSDMRPLKTITNPHLISSRKCLLRKQELPSMIERHRFSYSYHFYHPFYCCYHHQSIANSLFVLRQKRPENMG